MKNETVFLPLSLSLSLFLSAFYRYSSVASSVTADAEKWRGEIQLEKKWEKRMKIELQMEKLVKFIN